VREVGVNCEVVIHAQERKKEKLEKQNFHLRFKLKARVRLECGESAARVRIAAIASCVELEALL